jgi:hypothetical protein
VLEGEFFHGRNNNFSSPSLLPVRLGHNSNHLIGSL